MTPATLETELRAFLSNLLAPLLDDGKSPIVKHQIEQQQQTSITLGVRIPGVDPEHIRTIFLDGQAVSKAWLQQWPDSSRVGDMTGRRLAKSVAIAQDHKHVVMVLVFPGLKIEKPGSLTPAA